MTASTANAGWMYSTGSAERRSSVGADRARQSASNRASTDPHHKHVPPDIKRHRIPAPGLSFEQPNLPFLIAEVARVATAQ
jgi:hypothetical protein